MFDWALHQWGTTIIVLMFVVVVLPRLFGGMFTFIRIVPQGYEIAVTRWGKFHRSLKATGGLQLLVPFWERGETVMVKERWVPISPEKAEGVITKDNVPVTNANGQISYQVVDVEKYLYGIDKAKAALQRLAQSTLRSEIGSMTLAEMLTGRTTLAMGVLDALRAKQERWGIEVLSVEILQLDLPDKVTSSLEEVIEADNAAKAAKTRAKGQSDAIVELDTAIQAHPAATEFQLATRWLETMAQVGEAGNSVYFVSPNMGDNTAGLIAGIKAAGVTKE